LPDLVIKVGGSLLSHVEQLDGVLAAIARTARCRRLLVVPGGGPFADAVREVDRRVGIPEAAAHRMAILAMDQFAHLLAARLSGGTVIAAPDEARRALDASGIPVLAPSRWLAAADPLPSSWDVTSDSIAAWVAGQLRARELMLIKAPGARGERLVDAYFEQALPPGIVPTIVAADEFVVAAG
jgi:aspartokinase-like uncharacterized kinase